MLTAFEQVNENFGNLFKHLFGGGEANLVLVESEDPLDAGLEIMCQPPGKEIGDAVPVVGWGTNTDRLALILLCSWQTLRRFVCWTRLMRRWMMQTSRGSAFAGRNVPPDGYTVPDYHAPRGDDGTDGPFVWCDNAGTGVSQLVSVDLKKAEQLVANRISCAARAGAHRTRHPVG